MFGSLQKRFIESDDIGLKGIKYVFRRNINSSMNMNFNRGNSNSNSDDSTPSELMKKRFS